MNLNLKDGHLNDVKGGLCLIKKNTKHTKKIGRMLLEFKKHLKVYY